VLNFYIIWKKKGRSVILDNGESYCGLLQFMAERLAAGVFFDGEMTDSLVRADSLWMRGH